ncbi:amidohydrolase family protein [Pelagibius sp. CAU 1746]|uniref:metal-dependent hydrolase family protein n=1 Tax=Pelagibius sp. CAU 1746 TaxID=3140370 RepID=UPI00325B2555
MANTVFRNVRIFDGLNDSLYPGEVEVQGNRILSVAKGGEELSIEGKTVVDGGGATLMPGLVNTHGHLTYPAVTTLEEMGRMPVEENLMESVYNAKLVLDFGFTAVVSGASGKPRLDIVLRNEINRGRIPGPRMLAASPEMTVSGGLADANVWEREVPANGLVADTPDEFRKLVRLMMREGVNIIKFNNSGDSFCYPRVGSVINPMTPEEVRAICETTNNLGGRLAAHAHADSSVLQCIEYGVEFIYHATFVTDRTIEALEKAKGKHYVTPAFGLRYNMHFEGAPWGITQEVSEKIGNKREFDATIVNMIKMREAGIKVLPFGDYGFKMIPLGTDSRDLQHFVNYFGFAPWEALRAATAYGGEAYGVDKLGQVKAGYLADLLMIDGDPVRDLSLLLDRDRIVMIMKDGAYHKPLPENWGESAEAAARA